MYKLESMLQLPNLSKFPFFYFEGALLNLVLVYLRKRLPWRKEVPKKKTAPMKLVKLKRNLLFSITMTAQMI